MDGSPDAHPETSPGASASGRPDRRRITADELPSELAFWALWHCRHARPPDTFPTR